MHTSTQLDEILARVTMPARYAGGEFNSCRKDPSSVALRAALIYPDVYEVGMSSLGFQVIYHFMNRRADTFCERAFAPWPDMERELRSSGMPLYTLETFTPLNRLGLIGFSLGSELTYTNVLTCLDLGGIPLLASARGRQDAIVIAGGHCAFNPEPMAEFIDAFVIGEGEEVIDEIIDSLVETMGASRDDRLRALADIEGVYVPAFVHWQYGGDGSLKGITVDSGVPSVVHKRLVRDFEHLDYPSRPVVPNIEVVHDRVVVEVMRGCTQGCRFCEAGMVTRPVRERSAQRVQEMVEQLLPATGYDEISLVSLSSADYSGVESAVKELTERYGGEGVGISLPSLRADTFSVDLAAQIQRVRRTGLTFAVEAGSERLRRVINKNISGDSIASAARSAWRQGWRKLKLYAMIGLPAEEDEDIVALGALVRDLQKQAWQDAHIKLGLNVGASAFVPKAHTSFQWRGQVTAEELEHKTDLLRNCVRGPGVKLSWSEPRQSQLEAVLARGDRRVGQVISQAWKGGARLDAWREWANWQAWDKAFEITGLDPAYYASRQREYTEVLPWDHIDCGVTKRFLQLEDERATGGEPTPDCRWDTCHGCGMLRLLPEHAPHGTCYHG